MPNHKVKCSKCLSRHLPPTGKKCKLFEVTASSDAEGESGVKSPVTRHQREAAAADVQMQILQQLQTVNKRLDNMEGEVAEGEVTEVCISQDK